MGRSLTLALAALACLVLPGCGGTRADVKYRIAVIPKGLTHEFWQSIHRGAERAAADLGSRGVPVQIRWDGPLRENDDQISIVERNLGQRVSGIVLAPQHSETLVPAVQHAHEQRIPVVIIDSGLARPELFLKYVATDNYNGGRLAAERLLATLARQGKTAPRLILFRYQVGSESTEQREKGFEDVVNARLAEQKKAGQPTITWLSNDKYAGPTVDSAEREAGPLLARLRDQQPDGIFAVNESAATGMLNALRSQGLNQKITLVGFDSSQPLLQAVEEGDVDALIVQDPYRMGYLGVWVLVQHLEGRDVSGGGKNLGTGEYVLTRENLHDPATRQRFDPELQKQRTIDAPEFPRR